MRKNRSLRRKTSHKRKSAYGKRKTHYGKRKSLRNKRKTHKKRRGGNRNENRNRNRNENENKNEHGNPITQITENEAKAQLERLASEYKQNYDKDAPVEVRMKNRDKMWDNIAKLMYKANWSVNMDIEQRKNFIMNALNVSRELSNYNGPQQYNLN